MKGRGKPKAITLSEEEWVLVMSALYEAADSINDWSEEWAEQDLVLLTIAVQKLNMELGYLVARAEEVKGSA